MLKKFVLYFTFCVIFGSTTISAYSELRVRDPRGWSSIQGTIEEATVSIKPKGVYMEIGLYLTFSARDWNHGSQDSLEVEFYFDLPENSIVHDSWLWVEGEIIRGEIMDKWTASEIYENIVRRRRDPSILFKRSQNSYELRIFPMVASETRKVKLTYLVPTEWNSRKIFASLPTELLRTSRYDLPNLTVLTWLEDDWKNPEILGFPEIQFQEHRDDFFGDYVKAVVPSDAIDKSLHFTLDSPLKNGIYVNHYREGNDGYYQLAYIPSKALTINANSKVAVLFDYESFNSNISTEQILESVKNYLISNHSKIDSLNLIFSRPNINRASENWIYADSANIENLFKNLESNSLASYSNLPSLLANGIDFIKENGDDGNIVLISNSDHVGDFQIANQLMEDLLLLMNADIPIHVADFQDRNYQYFHFGARSYVGNEYFYKNISRMTSANYFNVRSGLSFDNLISSVFGSMTGFVSSFDLYTSLVNGYCYGRFNLSNYDKNIYLDQPIVQVGKYYGDFPFTIESSGVYNSEVFSEKINIYSQNIFQGDSISRKIWAGNYINDLESDYQSNDVVNEIVNYSISERVLSIYSAFLCLEPNGGGEVCFDCIDETQLTDVDETESLTVDFVLNQNYPNPFNPSTTIEYTLPAIGKTFSVSLKIYNSLGQLVATLVEENQAAGTYSVIWDGKDMHGNQMPSGIYFYILQAGDIKITKKMMLLK